MNETMNQPDPNQPGTPHAAPPKGEAWPAAGYGGDEVNAGLVAIVGVFAAVVFLLIVVLLQAWFYNWKGQIATARAVPPDSLETPLGRMLAEQQTQIDSYHWVDRKAGVRAIPIQRAMEIVAAEMAGKGSEKKSEVKHDKADKQ
jgi:hypothetical protein